MTNRSPDWRERKKRATRQAIRQAGLNLFLDKGYAATSIKDITDAADVSLRSFYQYFEMKEDLLLVEVREFLADVEEVLEQCPPSLSAVECHFRSNDELRRRWSPPSGVLSTNDRLMYQLGINDADVEARFHLIVNQHVARVCALFARRLGLDRSALDVQLLARLGGVAFATSLTLAAGTSDPVDVFEIREEVLIKLGQGLDPEAVSRRQALSDRGSPAA